MSLITEELLEKALSYERPGDQQLRQYRSTVKAVLELVANEIAEVCAVKADEIEQKYMGSPDDPHTDAYYAGAETAAYEISQAIRSLKTKE